MPRLAPPPPGVPVPQDQMENVLRAIENDEQIAIPQEDVAAPSPDQFRLSGGWHGPTGTWDRDFRVRELNGYDEEALAKMVTNGAFLSEIMLRGLVSVGDTPASRELVDSLQAGDWETVLLAIRRVTFGNTADFWWSCTACDNRFEFTFDIDAVGWNEYETAEDMEFSVTVSRGRPGTGNTYDVEMPTGGTQRRMLNQLDHSNAEQNTTLLIDCVTRVNNRASLGRETVLQMPMGDRLAVIQEINARRPGPRLTEVTTVCPSCAAVNATPLSIAALFRP